ncbi:TDR15 protein, partial [Polyodon spathula]|nr:TDR15 protein [Polyodon spathula]
RPSTDSALSVPCAVWPVDLKLTHIDCNPENSLVHLQGQYLTVCELDYNIVQVEIQNTPKTKEPVEIGAFCLVEDISGYWYRGRVQNRRNDVFDVFLIDNGTVLSVDTSHLASASDELFMLPPKIVCGFFSNIQPTGKKWEPLAVKYFLSLHGLEVKGYIQAILPHKVLVLEVPDVNKEVIKLGLGKAVDKDTFLLLVEMLTELPLKQNSEPVPDLLIERHIGQEFSFKPSSFHCFQNVVASSGPQVTIGKTERVKLTSAINAGTFYCQLMYMSLDLQELTEKLSYCCESKFKELCEKSIGNVGLLCAVKGKDEKWHRGFVQQVLSNGHARVLFVDYGFCEIVKAEHILPLPPDFHSAPIMSFPCALSCLTELDEELQKRQMNELKKGLLRGILYIRPDSFKPDHHLYYVTLLSPLDGADQGFQKDSCKRQPFTEPYGKPTYTHTVQEQNSIQEMCKTPPSSNDWDISNRKPTTKATYQIKELEDGSIFVGYVEHVLNPSEFWIRADDHNGEFEEMMKNIACFYDSLELDEGILDNPEPGLLCCAMFEKDMQYYRAVIVDVFENGAEVFFLDFGNTDKVPYMCIKTLPLRFAEVPVLAFRCSLAHVVPVEDVWTANATSVFRTAVLNKVLLVHVVQKRKDKYIVDVHVKEIESKFSVITLLVQAGFAEYWKEMPADHNQKLAKTSWDQQSKRNAHKNVSVMQSQRNSKSKETSPVQSVASLRLDKVPCNVLSNSFTEEFLKLCTSASVSSEQGETSTKVTIKPQIFKVGCVLDVKISCIDSPSEFWCQVKNQSSKMELLMKDIQCYYHSHADSFQPGELACVAKRSKDGKWYRGCVVQQMKGKVDVLFVDSGVTEQKSIKNVRAIKPEFLHLEWQAFRCSLYNLVEPVEGNPCQWSKDACQAFQDFAQSGSELKCIIHALTIIEKRGLCNVVDIQTPFQSASQLLVEKGFARDMGTPKGLIPSVHLYSYYHSLFNMKIGSEEKVYTTHVCSPWELYCQLDKNTEVLQDLMAEVTVTVSEMQEKGWDVGPIRLCLARYHGDGLWYRGLAFPVQSPLHLNVFFVDYGNMHVVEKSDVLPVPAEAAYILLTPMQAVKCTLSDIPEGELLVEVNKWLEENVLNKPLNAVVVAKEYTGNLVIELYDGNLQINEKVKELMSLHRQKIKPVDAEEPAAKHYQKRQRAAKLPKTKSDTKVKNQGRNQRSSVNEPYVTGSQMRTKENNRREPSDANERKSIGNMLPKCSELPETKIKPGTKSIGFISHFRNTSDFYIQLEEDEQSLLTMVEELNGPLFTEDLDNNISGEVKVDDLVAVEFEEDRAFYRAVVKDISADGSLQVEFIDYGNTATVDKTKVLRLADKFITKARLSIACFLEKSGSLKDESHFKENVIGKPLSLHFVKQKGPKWEVTMNANDETVEDESAQSLPPCTDLTEQNLYRSSCKSEVPTYSGIPSKSKEDTKEHESSEKGRSNLLSVKNIRVGHECLARSEKECLWHRAEVEEIFTESEEVSVVFFDHGATERIAISNVKELADDLKHVPRQAVLCKWHGCEKLKSESGEVLKNSLKPLMDQEIKLLFVSVFNSPPVWEVEIMVDDGLLVHHIKDPTSVRDEEIRKSIPKLGYLQNGENVNDITPPQSLTLAPVQTNKEYSGFAAAVIDPSEFFIELEDLFLTMNTVSVMLAELPEDLAALPVELIKPGSCCLVNSESKNKWCRAEITEVENNYVLTTLVDYGHCSPVRYSDLNKIKKLPEELARLPKLTYPCLLRGVKPINREHWTDEAIIFFQESISHRNLIIYFRRYVFEALWEVDIVIGDVDIANELAAAGHAAYIENM